MFATKALCLLTLRPSWSLPSLICYVKGFMSEAGACVRQIPPLLELVVIKGVSPISLSLRWPSCSSYHSCLHLAEIKDFRTVGLLRKLCTELNSPLLWRRSFFRYETTSLGWAEWFVSRPGCLLSGERAHNNDRIEDWTKPRADLDVVAMRQMSAPAGNICTCSDIIIYQVHNHHLK